MATQPEALCTRTPLRSNSIASDCLSVSVLVTFDLGLEPEILIYFLGVTLLIQIVHLSCWQTLQSDCLPYHQQLWRTFQNKICVYYIAPSPTKCHKICPDILEQCKDQQTGSTQANFTFYRYSPSVQSINNGLQWLLWGMSVSVMYVKPRDQLCNQTPTKELLEYLIRVIVWFNYCCP